MVAAKVSEKSMPYIYWCMALIVGVSFVEDRTVFTKVLKLVAIDTFILASYFSYLTSVVVSK